MIVSIFNWRFARRMQRGHGTQRGQLELADIALRLQQTSGILCPPYHAAFWRGAKCSGTPKYSDVYDILLCSSEIDHSLSTGHFCNSIKSNTPLPPPLFGFFPTTSHSDFYWFFTGLQLCEVRNRALSKHEGFDKCRYCLTNDAA